MFGKLSSNEIEAFLQGQLIGRIGCHSGKKTYIVPISYAYDGSFIYCHTQEGMKLTMMRENPEVCFEVDKLSNMSRWESVIIWGVFEEILNTEERSKALKILLSRAYPFISSKKMQLGAHWPFPPEDVNIIKGTVFKIKPSEKTGRFEEYDNLETVLVG